MGVTIVDAQFSVLTTSDYNFDQDNPIGAMGSAPVSGGTSTTFTVANAAANRDFIFSGSGFTYDLATMPSPRGTITSILETTDDASHTPLASFALNVAAADWMNAVVAQANGDQSLIEALVSPWTFNFIGNAGADAFGASRSQRHLHRQGRQRYVRRPVRLRPRQLWRATGAINVQLAAGTVTGDASVGTDTLKSIEMVTGSNFADTYNATGFSCRPAPMPAAR